MAFTVEVMSARSRPEDQLGELFGGGWPEFIFHDQETQRHIGRIRELFGGHELVLLDEGVIVAAGWGAPLRWDGRLEDLPAGYNDSLVHALGSHDSGEIPDTFAILAAQVHPGRRGQGLAGRLLAALQDQPGFERHPSPR